MKKKTTGDHTISNAVVSIRRMAASADRATYRDAPLRFKKSWDEGKGLIGDGAGKNGDSV